MPHSLRVRGEALVRGPLGAAQDAAQIGELPVVPHRQDHESIGSAEVLVGNDVRMRIAHAARNAAADQIVRGLVRERCDLHVEQGQVDVLPLARSLAVGKGREDGGDGVQPGHHVRQGNADLERPLARRTIGATREAHQPTHALDQEVVAGARGVRAGLSEARYRAEDQARVARLQTFIVEAVSLQSADLEVLDQHIGLRRELPHQRLAGGRCDVDGKRALVAIGAEEVRRIARVASVFVLQPGRSPCAGVVARGRPLDLHNVRTEIAEHLRAPGTGENA